MSDASQPVDRRHEFILYFDVIDGNPNGDPDAGNAPRIDPETGQGLVTDVCLKRKIRNYVHLTQAKGHGIERKTVEGYEIYVKERGILAVEQKRAYSALNKEADGRSGTVKEARAWMCKTFFDVRAFGAVMSTGKAGDEDAEPKPEKGAKYKEAKEAKKKPAGAQKLWNCGQVRGPIQISFSRSIDPILTLEHAITRVALTNQDDTKRGQDLTGEGEEASSGQMGRKSTVPYALYRAHGFISPFLAADTKFSKADLDLFWKALVGMFEHDRSASRGMMAARKLIVFEHDSALGNEAAHRLFERVKCDRKREAEPAKAKRPARSFGDYQVTFDGRPIEEVNLGELPIKGVTVHSMI